MKVRKALGINALSQLIIFAVSFSSVIVISRLLAPEEIGIFSVSISILAFAHIFREFGVGQFLIQTAEVTPTRLRAAFSVTLGISWTIAALLVTVRTPVSSFYGTPAIAEVLAIIAVSFVILPFGSPLISLLRRDMQFDKIAIVNIANAVVGASVTIIAALLGESYLSMAWGSVAGNISNVVILNFMRPGQVFMLPGISGLREVLRFGSLSSAGSIISELGTSAPDLIFGRTLGFASVAYFGRGDGLRAMAIGQIVSLVRGVYLPSFARDVREGGSPAELYCRAMNYMVAFSAPALAVLAVLAEPLILFLFGPQWEPSALIATLICSFAILTTPTSLASTSLIACGRAGLLLKTQMVSQSVKIAIIMSSVWLTLEQVVMALGLSYLIESYVLLRALRKAFGLHIFYLWRSIRRTYYLVFFATTGPVAIMLYQHNSSNAMPTIATLLLGGILALLGWLLGIFLTTHPLKNEASILLTRLIKPIKDN